MGKEQLQAALDTCDREPIHILGRVQSHGVLLVLEPAQLLIRHASENTSVHLGVQADSIIGKPLGYIIDGADVIEVRTRIGGKSIEANLAYVGIVRCNQNGGRFHAVVHRFGGKLFLELESAEADDEITFSNLYSLLRTATGSLKGAISVADLWRITAHQIRQITGFDRVMIYQFDENWNGGVVAESKINDWNSYQDLHFPASDIPKQARELYLLNRLRLIVDVHSESAALIPNLDPATGTPVDMSYAALRSVSPIHIQYLKNMGVSASMSISIVKDERLWGLIALHHRTGKRLAYEVRAACEHISEIAALQLSAKAYAEGADYRIALNAVRTRLLAKMAAHDNFADGLSHDPDELLGVANASGCALHIDGELRLVGQTPSSSDVQKLIDWLRTERQNQTVFHTDCLSSVYPPAASFAQLASGILLISVSSFRDNVVLWFRPEMIQIIKWAGNPNKAVEPATGDVPGGGVPGGGMQQLHPRKSFDAWRETVRAKSLPWKAEEIDSAAELREAMVGIILRQAEELAAVNAQLQRTNKELEAFSYSVSHDLRAPFRHISAFAELLNRRASNSLDDTSRRYLKTITDSASFAGSLVDGLLAFSKMNRTALKPSPVEMSQLVDEVRADLFLEAKDRKIDWQIEALPCVTGDVMMLKLAVRNLLANAIKYSRPRETAIIQVGSRDEADERIFWVRDNGVGFDMRFKHKLFGVFQRLHRPEEFEGTGIGLANVARTIERHGGRVWAESQLGEGATFFFSLPKQRKENS